MDKTELAVTIIGWAATGGGGAYLRGIWDKARASKEARRSAAEAAAKFPNIVVVSSDPIATKVSRAVMLECRTHWTTGDLFFEHFARFLGKASGAEIEKLGEIASLAPVFKHNAASVLLTPRGDRVVVSPPARTQSQVRPIPLKITGAPELMRLLVDARLVSIETAELPADVEFEKVAPDAPRFSISPENLSRIDEIMRRSRRAD